MLWDEVIVRNLVEHWLAEIEGIHDLHKARAHWACQRIVEEGEKVVPILLRKLAEGGSHKIALLLCDITKKPHGFSFVKQRELAMWWLEHGASYQLPALAL